jgi:hypothetical protein
LWLARRHEGGGAKIPQQHAAVLVVQDVVGVEVAVVCPGVGCRAEAMPRAMPRPGPG